MKLLVTPFTPHTEDCINPKNAFIFNNDSRHMYIKTFTKQDLDILCYQFVIHENMNFAKYQMSHKGAAGKAFSCLSILHFSG